MTFASRGTVLASDARYDRQPGALAEIDAAGPAFLFVRPRAIKSAAVAVGTGLLDPGCAVGGERCLTAALLDGYLRAHGIAERTIEIGEFEVVVPSRKVASAAVFAFARVRT